MRKRACTIEWDIAEDDADWASHTSAHSLDSLSGKAGATACRPSSKQFLASLAAILLLMSAGYWWWLARPTGSQQAKAEVRATAQKEFESATQGANSATANHTDNPTDRGSRLQQRHEAPDLRTAVQSGDREANLDISLNTVEVEGDRALARVVIYTEHGTSAYRQTRFYRHVGSEWRQSAPEPALWGPERTLETPSFVYHFRQNDAPVVISVAPQIEALYTALRSNFGLDSTPAAEKLVVQLSVTQTPGDTLSWFRLPGPLTVPSPSVYLAPVELTDAELLEESIALPLLNYVVDQASKQDGIGTEWRSLLSGLRLWQVWEMDLPLSVWRKEVVKWVYLDKPGARFGQAVTLPDQYAVLCAMHNLWMPAPVQIGIPLLCVADREGWHFAQWGSLNPPNHSIQLAAPASIDIEDEMSNQMSQQNYAGYAVVLETLIEYAVATYGRERLPALVAGLGRYDTWETLLPAVYGVSPAQFEAGWRAYLAAHYGR